MTEHTSMIYQSSVRPVDKWSVKYSTVLLLVTSIDLLSNVLLSKCRSCTTFMYFLTTYDFLIGKYNCSRSTICFY